MRVINNEIALNICLNAFKLFFRGISLKKIKKLLIFYNIRYILNKYEVTNKTLYIFACNSNIVMVFYIKTSVDFPKEGDCYVSRTKRKLKKV